MFLLCKNICRVGYKLNLVPSDTSETNKLIFFQESIFSRTRHVLSALGSDETTEAQVERIEDLIFHLAQFPEAKRLVVKVRKIDNYLHFLLQGIHPITVILYNWAVLGHNLHFCNF